MQATEYYKQLLIRALEGINAPAAFIAGALGYGTDVFEENRKFLESMISKYSEQEPVFNQLPWQDYNFLDAPYEYEEKFEVFYKGLIQSGKISKLYVLPSHVQSVGAQKEIAYAKEVDINVEYLVG
ncbi:MAG: hypothetical protein ACI83D_000335 [Planctomycetota bacterium]|jgi:hypothetical protein